MGAFDDVPDITIPRSEEERIEWGWEPHERVVLKGRLDVADQKFTANKMSKINKKGDIETQVGTGRFGLLERMILSWTFKYRGQDVLLNTQAIDRLPSSYSNRILSVIDEIAIGGMNEEEQSNFLPSANGHTSVDSDLVRLPQTTL